MAPNAETSSVEKPVLALEGLYDQMSKDPTFHPDYSSFFNQAIADRRNGVRGVAVPYNGMQKDNDDHSLSKLYDSLLDEPNFHPDYSQLFSKALTEKRCGKATPMVLKYGSQYKQDSPKKKVELYLPERPKKSNVLLRLMSLGRRRLICGATGQAPPKESRRGASSDLGRGWRA